MKELVELHGGRITGTSEGEGCGATFRVELPLAAVKSAEGDRVHPRAVPLEPAPGDLPRIDGVHLLLVDDHRDAAEAIAHVLERAGATVTLPARRRRLSKP